MFTPNERFKDALKTLAEKESELMTFLDRNHSFVMHDQSDDSHFCKIVAMMLSDTLPLLEHMHTHAYCLPKNHQQQMLQTLRWKFDECMWVCEQKRTDDTKMLAKLHPYMLDVYHNFEYANRVFSNNPEDFSKFDKALDALPKFFQNRLAKGDEHDHH